MRAIRYDERSDRFSFAEFNPAGRWAAPALQFGKLKTTMPDVGEVSSVDTRQARASSTALAVCFATAAAALSTAALAQQLPPGATPGGVLPRLAAAVPSGGSAGAVLSIPPVADRPVGKDEGPKLLVRSFKLDGVSGRAGHGISEADAKRVLDGALSTEPADGYTVNQLQGADPGAGVRARPGSA
jgi:hypothetical protein